MFVPSNAIPSGAVPTAKVPSFLPLGDSLTTLLPLATHMFVPSNAIAPGEVTAKVPSFAPVGDSSMTLLLEASVTHMFVPSNAMPAGFVPTAKVPTGPHVPGWLQLSMAFLQTPAPKEALGPRGARQSATAGQASQRPVAQSLLVLHDARHAVPPALHSSSPGHVVPAFAAQDPLPSQLCVVSVALEHVSAPQLSLEPGYTHAPDASQS